MDNKSCKTCIISKLIEKPCKPDGRGYCDFWYNQSPQTEVEELKRKLDECLLIMDHRFSQIKELEQQIEELIIEHREIDNINTDLRIELQKAKLQIMDISTTGNQALDG